MTVYKYRGRTAAARPQAQTTELLAARHPFSLVLWLISRHSECERYAEPLGSWRRSKMLNKTEQSDRAPNANEKPEDCYCSALPKGSGLCLPCYTRWLAGERPRPGN